MKKLSCFLPGKVLLCKDDIFKDLFHGLVLGVHMKLEILSVNFFQVLYRVQELKIRNQMLQFLIFWVIVVRSDWDAVVDLEREGVGSVIDQNDIVQIPVR